MTLDLGTRVRIKETSLSGEVVGHGYRYESTGGAVSVHLVELKEGFWNADKTTFISVMSVHEDNLTILENVPISF